MHKGPPPNADTILSLLNSEIETAAAEQTRSGWTLWALGGTLTATCLFILEQVERGGLDAVHVAKWFIAIILPVDAILTGLQSWSKQETGSRSYRSLREARGHQFGVLWRALTHAAFCAVAIFASSGVWVPAVCFAVLWFLFIAGLNLLIFGLLFVDTHYKQDRDPVGLTVAVLGTLLVMLTIAGASYAMSLPPLTNQSTSEFRLAVSIVVWLYVFQHLLLWLRRPWLVERLTLIRRQLVLGIVDVPTATRAAEVALMGMEAHTALDEDLTTTLNLHEEMQNDVARLQIKLQQVELKLMPASQPGSPVPLKLDGISEDLDALSELHKVVARWRKQVARRTTMLDRGINTIRDEAPVSYAKGYDAFRERYDELAAKNTAFDQLTNDLEVRMERVKTLWKNVQAAIAQRRKLLRKVPPARG